MMAILNFWQNGAANFAKSSFDGFYSSEYKIRNTICKFLKLFSKYPCNKKDFRLNTINLNNLIGNLVWHL